MKPEVDRFLEVGAAYLVAQLAPTLASPYDQSNVTTMGALLVSVREEFDRAAARRVEENHALRRLFAEAAPDVHDAALRARLEDAAAGTDTSVRVSTLERANAELRAVLIDLHVHVEGLATPAARRIETAIWQELVASTERRRLMMGPF